MRVLHGYILMENSSDTALWKQLVKFKILNYILSTNGYCSRFLASLLLLLEVSYHVRVSKHDILTLQIMSYQTTLVQMLLLGIFSFI